MYRNNNAARTGKPRFGSRPQGGGQGGQRRNQKSGGGGRGRQYINPAKFINRDVEANVAKDVYEPKHMFNEFGLVPAIEKNLERAGFTAPSAIQDQTIPLVMDGRDIIGLANTGTGKTAAFLLPIIDKLSRDPRPMSVLIMAPTRELAQQINEEFRKFSDGMRLFSTLCVGGMNIIPQLRGLQRRPHVIIGTPGRLKDHIQRGSLTLNSIGTFVLDEADRMLDMGFVADIRAIASQLPRERQTLCFSATLSDGIRVIVNDFMNQPETVSVKVNETNDHIYQDVVHFTDNEHKKDLLLNMLGDAEFEKVIVFGETKFGVQRLSDTLEKQGVASSAIHGNKSQSQRSRALDAFKSNKTRVLVATDVAARGLDIPSVSHVINFDLPQSYDDYVHRIGRTGRGGKSGTALTFVQMGSGNSQERRR